MVLVCSDLVGSWPDGEQTAAHGHEIQQSFCKRQSSKDHINSIFPCRSCFIEMAGRAGYFYRLHYFIFAFQKQIIMLFTAQVKVMPLKELLDPQGKAVL